MTTSKPLRFSAIKTGLVLLLLVLGFCVFISSVYFFRKTAGRPLPTWTQGTFVFCFVVLAPLVVILSVFQRREKMGIQKRIGLVYLVLLGSAAIAILLFPGYPQTSTIPEHLAVLFTLPALLAGIVVLWLERSTEEYILVILAVYLAGVWLSYGLFTLPERKALPWSATQVREYLGQLAFFWPESEYCLKAKISADEFENYVNHYDLVLQESDYIEGCDVDWWDIGATDHTVYGKHKDFWRMLVVYEDGFIYVVRDEW